MYEHCPELKYFSKGGTNAVTNKLELKETTAALEVVLNALITCREENNEACIERFEPKT